MHVIRWLESDRVIGLPHLRFVEYKCVRVCAPIVVVVTDGHFALLTCAVSSLFSHRCPLHARLQPDRLSDLCLPGGEVGLEVRPCHPINQHPTELCLSHMTSVCVCVSHCQITCSRIPTLTTEPTQFPEWYGLHHFCVFRMDPCSPVRGGAMLLWKQT